MGRVRIHTDTPTQWPCNGCGITFALPDVQQYLYRKGKRSFFHDRKCAVAHRKPRQPFDATPVEWPCSGCGVVFTMSPNGRKFYRQGRRLFYHNLDCSNLHKRRRPRGPGKRQKTAGTPYTFLCATCGKEKDYTYHQRRQWLKGKRTFFCSRICYNLGNLEAAIVRDSLYDPDARDRRRYQRWYRRVIRSPKEYSRNATL